MKLNENQKRAITSSLDPTIVIAGPGSGKTQVICHRINYMINSLGCVPMHILVVTFSKLAAEEMKERYIQQFGNEPVNFGTLHSIFYRILRKANPTQYDLNKLLMDDKRKVLLEQLIKEAEIDEGEDFLDGFIRHLSLMKNQLIIPNDYEPSGISKSAFLQLEKRYEAYKARHGLFDFDDMLVDCYYLLKNDEQLLRMVATRYRYVLVDEFQDINLVQFEILKLIVSEHQHLFVVGDDDQSIYQFRGAKPAYLLDFKKYFKLAQEIYLNVNYRCSGAILESSLSLIEKNVNRYHKDLVTPNPYGQQPIMVACKDAREEALHIIDQIAKYKKASIPLEEMAVIYRTNLQARPIVEQLIGANIPFCLRDGMISLYDQWITKDILAYLHLAQDKNDDELLTKIINKPKRYISKVNLEIAKKSDQSTLMTLLGMETLSIWQKDYLQEFLFDLQVIKEKSLVEAIRYIRHHIGYQNYLLEYAAYRKMPAESLLEVLDDIEDSASSYDILETWEESLRQMANQLRMTPKKRQKDMLTLTTMHGAKGLEFNTVFVIDLVDGIVPYHKSLGEEIEEERRLLYVAMTRAKEHLYLYLPRQKHGKAADISPFVQELKRSELDRKLKIGQVIYHKNLGKGTITKVLDNSIIIVQFVSGEKRKIDSIYCINNAIIAWEDDQNEKRQEN